MRCDLCGEEGVRMRHMTRTYGKGKDLLIVENIPVVSCPQLRQVEVASFA